jgi:hypothetical protein
VLGWALARRRGPHGGRPPAPGLHARAVPCRVLPVRGRRPASGGPVDRVSCVGVPRHGPDRSEIRDADDGRSSASPDTGRACGLSGTDPGTGPTAPRDLRLPGGSARCSRDEQTAVGRGENRSAGKSAGAPEGHRRREQGGGRGEPGGAQLLGGRGDGRDHPGKTVTALGGLDGGTEDGVRQLGRRCRQEGDPLTGQHSGSPRDRAAPVAPGVQVARPEGRPGSDGRAGRGAPEPAGRHPGGGQPVRRDPSDGAGECRAGDPGTPDVDAAVVHGATVAAAVPRRGRGTPGGRRVPGGGPAGGTVGVLGISRRRTGGSTPRVVGTAAGRPQARCSPRHPAPHRATRRTRPRRGAPLAPLPAAGCPCGRARDSGAVRISTPAGGAHRQARYSPWGPAPHRARRRTSVRSGPAGRPTGGAATGGRAGGGAIGGAARRAAGAGSTGRSGTPRTEPARAAVVRTAPDRAPAPR